jgi:hypothetical protein
MGKSIISNELEQLAKSSTTTTTSSTSTSTSSSHVNPPTTFKLLNSDLKSKSGVKGMRYWGEVVGAAEGHQGGGHRVILVADKNLVPAPPGNIQTVAAMVGRSGEREEGH